MLQKIVHCELKYISIIHRRKLTDNVMFYEGKPANEGDISSPFTKRWRSKWQRLSICLIRPICHRQFGVKSSLKVFPQSRKTSEEPDGVPSAATVCSKHSSTRRSGDLQHPSLRLAAVPDRRCRGPAPDFRPSGTAAARAGSIWQLRQAMLSCAE